MPADLCGVGLTELSVQVEVHLVEHVGAGCLVGLATTHLAPLCPEGRYGMTSYGASVLGTRRRAGSIPDGPPSEARALSRGVRRRQARPRGGSRRVAPHMPAGPRS